MRLGDAEREMVGVTVLERLLLDDDEGDGLADALLVTDRDTDGEPDTQ